MACADIDMNIHRADLEVRGRPSRPCRRDVSGPEVQRYEALELVPEQRGPLHDLLQKEPAVLGALQMVSGFLTVAMGIVFAATQEINVSLFGLFRVSQTTGTLFMFAGVVSNLLSKYPGLVPMTFALNCGCITVTTAAAALITVDLIDWNRQNQDYLMMEAMVLCVMALEVFCSALLCFWLRRQKQVDSL